MSSIWSDESETEFIDNMFDDTEDEEFRPNENELVDHFYSDEDSEIDSEVENEPGSDTGLISKDGRIWHSESFSSQSGQKRRENVISLRPGSTRYATSRVETILDAFLLFFPPSIEKIIIENSNNFGAHKFPEEHITIDMDLLHAYLGTLILAGVYRSKNESIDQLFDADFGRPIFRSVMSKRTFNYITKVLRFDDALSRRQKKSEDKFDPIRNLFSKWADLLPLLYNPFESVTIDEQLLGFRGRCSFRQYMPSKPAKYGLKFWLCVCSKTGYVWKIQPYLGKQPGSSAPEQKQGERVVLDLVDGLKGHNVTMDNFFSSYELGEKLLAKDLTMVGTLRKNKRSIPPKLLAIKKLPLYSSIFAFTATTAMVSYVGRKNKCVVLQSTLNRSVEVGSSEKKLPEIIQYYNETKGGVDTVDKMLACYSCKRKTNRWPMAVFANIVDISALNAFVIYMEQNPNWQRANLAKRRHFLHELGLSLAQSHMRRRTGKPAATTSRSLLNRLTERNELIDDPDVQEPKNKRNKSVPPQLKGRSTCYTCVEENNAKKRYMHEGKCCLCELSVCKNYHSRTVCVKCLADKLN